MPTDLRILLWDIDGTLLRSSRATAFVEYSCPVLETVFGTVGRIDELTLSGKTDLQFIRDALTNEGFTPEDIQARLPEIDAIYLREIDRYATNGDAFHVLPGVRELLEALAGHRRYRSALLTGNFKSTAEFKLRSVSLSDYFQLPGAFGEEAFDRRDLPALAAKRISQHLGSELQPSQFIVIGDTPDDISGARHFGARAVAVATGHVYGVDDLQRHRPDLLVSNLSDTQNIIEMLAQL